MTELACLSGFQLFVFGVGALVVAGLSGGFGALVMTLLIRRIRND